MEPWKSLNVPSINCYSARLYGLMKDKILKGGYAEATVTMDDFREGLRHLGKSAGQLTAVLSNSYDMRWYNSPKSSEPASP